MSKQHPTSQTPATTWLNKHGISYTTHSYTYEAKGGANQAAQALGIKPHLVAKTLVMEDETNRPLIVVMHGDREVSLKNLAREAHCKKVTPCTLQTAQRHSGYQIGGTSPFGTRKTMPVYVEQTLLELPEIYINGGSRGLLLKIKPQVLITNLNAKPVSAAAQ